MWAWTVVMLLDHAGGVVMAQYQVSAEDVADAVAEAWQGASREVVVTSSWPAPDVVDIIVFEGHLSDRASGRLAELKAVLG